MDEILVEIYKNDDGWVDVRVNIPSATICVLGKGVGEFKNDFLPSIKRKVEEENNDGNSDDSISCVDDIEIQEKPISVILVGDSPQMP